MRIPQITRFGLFVFGLVLSIGLQSAPVLAQTDGAAQAKPDVESVLTSKKITVVTNSNGAFWTQSAISFPATVEVSKCPDTQKMATTTTSGDCSKSGCHTSSMRLHLP